MQLKLAQVKIKQLSISIIVNSSGMAGSRSSVNVIEAPFCMLWLLLHV